jgi:midasin
VTCPDTFRVFAAQNPSIDGAGRKSLPQSFLNRFTRIAMKELADSDFVAIASRLNPATPPE